jgi:GcrA cell cycle regulator
MRPVNADARERAGRNRFALSACGPGVSIRLERCAVSLRSGPAGRATGHEANMTAIETAVEPPSAPPGVSRAFGATWTTERIDQLKACVSAGLTCSQIACELGVSRNAVIGKLNRLGLARGRAAAAARRTERLGVPRARHPSIVTQRQILRAVYAEAPPAAEAPSVVSIARCSLLELTQATCRWPISEPDARDFFFCGNSAVAGMPYCAGHVRMAYRVPTRQHA